ncbi:MAG: RNA polymerase sigma factor [Thermoguttaceae bacterium]|jgi:RNA polymerase sigma factor (sigma-70 family)
MDDSQATRPTLLARIRERADNAAWLQFVEIYTPLVYGMLRRRGLQDADAADVTQEVFCSVARSIQGYRGAGRQGAFRSWLAAITRSRFLDFVEKRSRREQGSGDTQVTKLLHEHPSPQSEQDLFEQEYKRRVFEWATERIRHEFQNSTWEAFWQTNMLGRSTQEVADSLGMTAGAVYIARSRVLARLKRQIDELDE